VIRPLFCSLLLALTIGVSAASALGPMVRPIIVNGAPTKYHREIVAENDELLRQRAEIQRSFSYWIEYLKKNWNNPDLAREALGHLCYAQGKQAEPVAGECRRLIQDSAGEDVAIAAVQCLNTIINEGGIDDAHAWANLDFMEKQLPVQKNTGVKVQAAILLFRSGETAKAVPVFLEAFRDTAFRNPGHPFSCRTCVVGVLAEIGSAPAKKALKEALGARGIDDMTRMDIGEALVKMHEDSAAIPRLDSLARGGKNMFIRIRALKAIASLVPAHPELRKAIEDAKRRDPESGVRREAEKLLPSQGSGTKPPAKMKEGR
jgi:hypothetical protein